MFSATSFPACMPAATWGTTLCYSQATACTWHGRLRQAAWEAGKRLPRSLGSKTGTQIGTCDADGVEDYSRDVSVVAGDCWKRGPTVETPYSDHSILC